MKFCQTHWSQLRDAIKARGLDGLVAKDGHDAASRTVSQLNDGEAPANFDPLMGAHNAIVSNALNTAGLAVMSPNDDGTDRCPICFLVTNCPYTHEAGQVCPFTTWVDRAADDMRDVAKRLGLMGDA